MPEIPVRELNPRALSALIESGEFHPAKRGLPLISAPAPPAADSAGLEALLADRYGDSRW